jgi:hypothetical protein
VIDPLASGQPDFPSVFVGQTRIRRVFWTEARTRFSRNLLLWKATKGLFIEEGAIGFSVEQTGGVNSRFPEKWPGVICPQLKWQTEMFDKNETVVLREA